MPLYKNSAVYIPSKTAEGKLEKVMFRQNNAWRIQSDRSEPIQPAISIELGERDVNGSITGYRQLVSRVMTQKELDEKSIEERKEILKDLLIGFGILNE